MMNIINGGAHSDAPIAFQEFMIRPVSAPSIKESIRMGAEVFHNLAKLLKARGLSTAVGDEGGFAPALDGIEDALQIICDAIKAAGYEPGKDVKIAMDCAASEFATQDADGNWWYDYSQLKNGKKKDPNGKKLSADEQIAYLEELITKFPIDSIEDGLDENDWDNWVKLTAKIGDRCQLVGDDLFVTNTKFLEKGIKMGAANSILIKVTRLVHSLRLSKLSKWLTVTVTLQLLLTVLVKLRMLLSLTSQWLLTLVRSRLVLCLVQTVWRSTTSLSASRKNSVAFLSMVTTS